MISMYYEKDCPEALLMLSHTYLAGSQFGKCIHQVTPNYVSLNYMNSFPVNVRYL